MFLVVDFMVGQDVQQRLEIEAIDMRGNDIVLRYNGDLLVVNERNLDSLSQHLGFRSLVVQYEDGSLGVVLGRNEAALSIPIDERVPR